MRPRIVQADGSVVTPAYNEAGVVATLDAQVMGQGPAIRFLAEDLPLEQLQNLSTRAGE